jgi:hypothetical protein
MCIWYLLWLCCRAEIEALNNNLFESGAASIAGLKANLARATAVLAATGDGREEVSCLQLLLLFLCLLVQKISCAAVQAAAFLSSWKLIELLAPPDKTSRLCCCTNTTHHRLHTTFHA